MRNYLITWQLFVIGLLIAPTSAVLGQYQISNVFRKYRNDEGVQHINLSGDIAKILQAKNQKLNSKVDEMHVYLFSKQRAMTAADKTKVMKARQSDGYEMLFQTKDKTERVEIYGIEKQNRITHLYAEIIHEGTSIYLLMTGSILFDDLSKMNFDFDGAGVFKKIPLP